MSVIVVLRNGSEEELAKDGIGGQPHNFDPCGVEWLCY